MRDPMKCKLCLKNKELQDSHIIPEFMFKPIYDRKHRYSVVSLESGEEIKSEQKGIREKLLCRGCEKFLNDEYEQYVHSVLYRKDSVPVDQDDEKITFHVDYNRFKLFQLSVLWRSGIAKNALFETVNLGLQHEEKLRRMIYGKNPGEQHEYGCMLSFFNIRDFPDTQMIVTPASLKIDGHICYSFIFAECVWTYIVSSHIKRFEYKDAFLSSKGLLYIYRNNAKNELVQEVVKKLKLKGKPYLLI